MGQQSVSCLPFSHEQTLTPAFLSDESKQPSQNPKGLTRRSRFTRDIAARREASGFPVIRKRLLISIVGLQGCQSDLDVGRQNGRKREKAFQLLVPV